MTKTNTTNNNPLNNNHKSTRKVIGEMFGFIMQRQARDHKFRECIRDLGLDRDKIKWSKLLDAYRYECDMALDTKMRNGVERRCITRLRNYETFVMLNHRHTHNNQRQNIEYHVGDHDLTKYLGNLLGFPYKLRIYFKDHNGNGHFLSTDSSGLDICHLECLKRLFKVNIETWAEGKALLVRAFPHGKAILGNKVWYQW